MIERLPTGDRPAPWVPTPVARPLDRVVAHLGAPDVSTVRTVFDRWDEIVGPILAGHTRPLRLDGGVLVVAADEPAIADQLKWLSNDLLERVANETEGTPPERLEVRVRANLHTTPGVAEK